MKLLLDTNVYLWCRLDSERLSLKAREGIADPANELWLSVVSLWEITIKFRLGKLRIPGGDMTQVVEGLRRDSIQILPFVTDHVLALERLELLHKDPFDRAILSQAIAEGFTLVTADKGMLAYPVEVLWS